MKSSLPARLSFVVCTPIRSISRTKCASSIKVNKRLSFYQSQRRLVPRATESSKPSGESAASAKNTDGKKSENKGLPSKTISKIADKLEVKDKLEKASKKLEDLSSDAQLLEAETDSPVLGGDINEADFPFTNVVRDLSVPAASPYYGFSPTEIVTYLERGLMKCEIPKEKRREVLLELGKLATAIRTRADLQQGKALKLKIRSSHRVGEYEESDDSKQKDNKLEKGKENDAAKEVSTGTALDALTWLLKAACFSVLPALPGVGDPSPADALPLGMSLETDTDSTMIRSSDEIKHLVKLNNVTLGSPSPYPYLFIATRGASLVRRSGFLLGEKLRALERACYRWIQAPITVLVSAMRRGGAPARQRAAPEGTAQQERRIPARQRIRRVVPSFGFKQGWKSIRPLFQSTISQEPCHEHFFLMYRPIEEDASKLRKRRQTAIWRQVRASLMTAVNPVPLSQRLGEERASAVDEENKSGASLESFERSPGKVKPIVMQMYANIPWGTIRHVFPSTYVLPATRDLLRVDLITFSGLASALYSFVRQKQNSSFLYLIFSFFSYTMRVIFGWQTALTSYNKTIAIDKIDSLLCQGRSCIDYITALAVEEMFADASCVWLAQKLPNYGLTAQDIQQSAFGTSRLDNTAIAEWSQWFDEERKHL